MKPTYRVVYENAAGGVEVCSTDHTSKAKAIQAAKECGAARHFIEKVIPEVIERVAVVRK